MHSAFGFTGLTLLVSTLAGCAGTVSADCELAGLKHKAAQKSVGRGI
jgi:hypothetical protein